jgi:hypothetical protein
MENGISGDEASLNPGLPRNSIDNDNPQPPGVQSKIDRGAHRDRRVGEFMRYNIDCDEILGRKIGNGTPNRMGSPLRFTEIERRANRSHLEDHLGQARELPHVPPDFHDFRGRRSREVVVQRVCAFADEAVASRRSVAHLLVFTVRQRLRV